MSRASAAPLPAVLHLLLWVETAFSTADSAMPKYESFSPHTKKGRVWDGFFETREFASFLKPGPESAFVCSFGESRGSRLNCF